jgi:hypothetical protein
MAVGEVVDAFENFLVRHLPETRVSSTFSEIF